MRSLAFAFLMSVSVTAVATEEAWPCKHAERDLERVQNWGAVYKYYRTYGGQCSDGALAEYLDGRFAILLDQNWAAFPELVRLVRKDKGFLDWIMLASIYDAEDENRACRIRENLRTKCSSKNRSVCEKLDTRVGSGEESMKACGFNSKLDTDGSAAGQPGR